MVIDRYTFFSHKGKICPVCQSENISDCGESYEKLRVNKHKTCNDCGENFTEIYECQGFAMKHIKA
jgi:transcriptional regulator NrdR family protein